MGDTVEVNELRSLTKSDILQFYRTLVASSPNRKKPSCHVVSISEGGAGHSNTSTELEMPEEAEATKTDDPVRKVTDITAFKSSFPLYPLAQPFIPSTMLCRPLKP